MDQKSTFEHKAIIFLLAVICYFLYSIHGVVDRATTFQAEAKCAEQSASLFASFLKDYNQGKETIATYRPHYSQTLHSCLMVIDTKTFGPEGKTDPLHFIWNRYLYDVFEAKHFGFLNLDSREEKPTCWVTFPAGKRLCDSSAGFDNLIKQYDFPVN